MQRLQIYNYLKLGFIIQSRSDWLQLYVAKFKDTIGQQIRLLIKRKTYVENVYPYK